MANITNEELKKKLINDEGMEYLEEHPDLYLRASQILMNESVSCASSYGAHKLDQAMKKAERLIKKLDTITSN